MSDDDRSELDGDEYVESLLSEAGYLAAVAELKERLRRGGTRDEVQAMRGELACLREFAQVAARRAVRIETEALAHELRQTQELLKSTRDSRLSFVDAPDLPFATEEGKN